MSGHRRRQLVGLPLTRFGPMSESPRWQVVNKRRAPLDDGLPAAPRTTDWRSTHVPVTSIPLRRRLFVLTAAAILPLATMAGLGLYALEQQQYVQAERVGLELARSVGTAVTAEVRSSISILETLATSPTLDVNDLAGFRELANRVIAAVPELFAIELADPTGRPLLDTRIPADLTVPDAPDDENVQRVVHSRAPLVGNLTGRSRDDFAFNV